MLNKTDVLLLEKIAYFLGYAQFLPSVLGLRMRIDALEMHTDLTELIGQLKHVGTQPVQCKFTTHRALRSPEVPLSSC